MGHVTKCAYCQRENKGLLDITKAENTFILEMNELGNSASSAKRPQTRPWARPWSWNTVSLISMIVLVAAIAAYSVFHFSSRSDYRRGPTASSQLISPVDKAVSGDELKFVWEGVPRAKFYIIETFDAKLDLIWRSEPLAGNEYNPPREVSQKFRPNEEYFWMVISVFEGGNNTKSGMGKFSLGK